MKLSIFDVHEVKHFWWPDSKASACNEGDLDLIPGSGRSSGEGNGNPLQYSWKIPWMEEPGRLDRTESLHFTS